MCSRAKAVLREWAAPLTSRTATSAMPLLALSCAGDVSDRTSTLALRGLLVVSRFNAVITFSSSDL